MNFPSAVFSFAGSDAYCDMMAMMVHQCVGAYSTLTHTDLVAENNLAK